MHPPRGIPALISRVVHPPDPKVILSLTPTISPTPTPTPNPVAHHTRAFQLTPPDHVSHPLSAPIAHHIRSKIATTDTAAAILISPDASSSRKYPSYFLTHWVQAVLDTEAGKSLEHQQLWKIQNTKNYGTNPTPTKLDASAKASAPTPLDPVKASRSLTLSLLPTTTTSHRTDASK